MIYLIIIGTFFALGHLVLGAKAAIEVNNMEKVINKIKDIYHTNKH